MFLSNKYTKWYYSIIDKAKSQNRRKSKEKYFESHHIIPSCLGGSDGKENRVLLTAREHFICHFLLTKMVEKESFHWFKLMKAFSKMKSSTNRQQRYFNSYLFESQRLNFQKANTGEKHPMWGRKHSDETKKMYSEKRKGEKHPLWGVKREPFSEETKRKMSESHKGLKPSDETRKKLSMLNTGENHPMWGRKHSDETKKMYSEKRKGKLFVTDGKVTKSATKEEFSKMDETWKIGRPNSPHKGMIYIHNYVLHAVKRIQPSELETYKSQGWNLGRGKGIFKERDR